MTTTDPTACATCGDPADDHWNSIEGTTVCVGADDSSSGCYCTAYVPPTPTPLIPFDPSDPERWTTPVAPAADHEALAALAEALPGEEWEVYTTLQAEDFVVVKGSGVWDVVATPNRGRTDYGRALAAFIAAVNPSVVLALIADLRALAEVPDADMVQMIALMDQRDAEKARADAAKAEVERLTREMDTVTYLRAGAIVRERDDLRAEVERLRAQGIADLAVAAESIRLLTDQRDAAEAAVARVRALSVDDVARVLIAAWREAEPDHDVTKYPASYVATFADLARAVILTTIRALDGAES